MNALLTGLLTILKQQVIYHEDLLAILHEETQSIGQAPASKLLKLQSAKTILSRKIMSIEEQRIQNVQEIADHWKVDETPLTLSQIIEKVPSDMKAPLSECFAQLKQVVKAIQTQALKNSKLSESRLKPIDMSLQFINDWHKSRQTYSGTGALRASTSTLSRTSI